MRCTSMYVVQRRGISEKLIRLSPRMDGKDNDTPPCSWHLKRKRRESGVLLWEAFRSQLYREYVNSELSMFKCSSCEESLEDKDYE